MGQSQPRGKPWLTEVVQGLAVVRLLLSYMCVAARGSSAVQGFSSQVTVKDDPRLLELPALDCPAVCTRLPRNCHPADRNNICGPAGLHERYLHRLPLAGLFWERNMEEIQMEQILENGEGLGKSRLTSTSQAVLVSTRRRHQNGTTHVYVHVFFFFLIFHEFNDHPQIP